MRIATAHLKSISPYSSSRHVRILKPDDEEQERYGVIKKQKKETDKDLEPRLWRHRIHRNDDGECFIPPMAFKFAIDAAAQKRSDKIDGGGKKTYTKVFKSGIMCMEPVMLGIKEEDVPSETYLCSVNGKRIPGPRVPRTFPVFREWEGDLVVHVLDDALPEVIFSDTLKEAGLFVGVGRFRPENQGHYGRFFVENITWSEA